MHVFNVKYLRNQHKHQQMPYHSLSSDNFKLGVGLSTKFYAAFDFEPVTER